MYSTAVFIAACAAVALAAPHADPCNCGCDYSCGDLGGSYCAGSYPGSGYNSYMGCGSSIQCSPQISNQIEQRVRPVVQESWTTTPVVRNSIRHQQECYTKNVPVVQNKVEHECVESVRHVPVVSNEKTPVIETETKHVPVIKQRVVPVVQKYVEHVPIQVKRVREVQNTIVRQVPVVQKQCRPVVRQQVSHVPVTECRSRPVVEQTIDQVPIKQVQVKPVVETCVRPIQSVVCREVPNTACCSMASSGIGSCSPFGAGCGSFGGACGDECYGGFSGDFGGCDNCAAQSYDSGCFCPPQPCCCC